MSPDGQGLTEIFEVHREPVLQDPVLVISLEGWVDAGLGATTAIATAPQMPGVTIAQSIDRTAGTAKTI